MMMKTTKDNYNREYDLWIYAHVLDFSENRGNVNLVVVCCYRCVFDLGRCHPDFSSLDYSRPCGFGNPVGLGPYLDSFMIAIVVPLSLWRTTLVMADIVLFSSFPSPPIQVVAKITIISASGVFQLGLLGNAFWGLRPGSNLRCSLGTSSTLTFPTPCCSSP